MQQFLSNLTDLTSAMDAAIWGVPMLMLLLGTGIYLTVRLHFLQFARFPFIMKKTVGRLFGKKERGNKSGTLTPV